MEKFTLNTKNIIEHDGKKYVEMVPEKDEKEEFKEKNCGSITYRDAFLRLMGLLYEDNLSCEDCPFHGQNCSVFCNDDACSDFLFEKMSHKPYSGKLQLNCEECPFQKYCLTLNPEKVHTCYDVIYHWYNDLVD